MNLLSESEVQVNISGAMNASSRAANISRLMLTYLGITDSEQSRVDLSDLYRKILGQVCSTLPEKVHLEVDFPDMGPAIQVDVLLFKEMLSQLLMNAAEAIGDQTGTIRVTICTVPADEISVPLFYSLDWQPTEESYACLSVSDTGSGMDNETFKKAFDPFFSTKFTGRGLGLAVVQGVVRSHNGAIAVESTSGKGTVFQIFLPLLREKVSLS